MDRSQELNSFELSPVHVRVYVHMEFYGIALLVFVGLQQSFAKWLSPQVKLNL